MAETKTLQVSGNTETNKTLSTKIETESVTPTETPKQEDTMTNTPATEDDMDFLNEYFTPDRYVALESTFMEDEEGFTNMMLDSIKQYSMNTRLQMSAIDYVSGFLSSTAGNIMTQTERELGLTQLKSDMQGLQWQYESMKTIFTTMPDFDGEPIEDATKMLNVASDVIENIERLSDYSEEILSHVGTTVNTVTHVFDNFNKTLENLESLVITNPLDKFPSLVSSKFLNLDIVQDSMQLVKTAEASAQNIITTFSSIRVPKNLTEAKNVIKQLRSIIDEARTVRSESQRVLNAFSNVYGMIKAGNYIQLAFTLASSASFFQRPPSYNAKYPYNFAYKTEGGHMFEVDNTKDSERITMTHTKGTSFEIQPDGATVFSSPSDMQMSLKGNQEVHASNMTIVLDNKCRIISNGTNIEVSGTANIAASTANITTTGNATVNSAGACSIMAGSTATISSAESTSISSNGKVSICGMGGVDIISDTGMVNILGTTGISAKTNGVFSSEAVGGISVSTPASETHKNTTGIYNSSGLCTIKGSLITLN